MIITSTTRTQMQRMLCQECQKPMEVTFGVASNGNVWHVQCPTCGVHMPIAFVDTKTLRLLKVGTELRVVP